MTKTILFACCAASALSLNAALLEFDLGPALPDGSGMHGLNENPDVITTASGGELEVRFPELAGISLNDGTGELFVSVGWGDVHGYTDLQSSFRAAHIHGPTSDVAPNAGVLYDLLAPGLNLDTATDGTFTGTIQLVENPKNRVYSVLDQIRDLKAGLWYINVHSDNNPGGEIRGNLVLVPEPETYAVFAGLALFGFALFRKFRPQQT